MFSAFPVVAVMPWWLWQPQMERTGALHGLQDRPASVVWICGTGIPLYVALGCMGSKCHEHQSCHSHIRPVWYGGQDRIHTTSIVKEPVQQLPVPAPHIPVAATHQYQNQCWYHTTYRIARCQCDMFAPTSLTNSTWKTILKMIDVLRMAFQISFLIEMLWNNGTGSPHHRIVNLIYLCHPRSPHHVPTPHPRCQRHLPPPHPRGCLAGQRGTVSSVGCPVDSAITPLSHTHTNLPTQLYPFQNTLKRHKFIQTGFTQTVHPVVTIWKQVKFGRFDNWKYYPLTHWTRQLLGDLIASKMNFAVLQFSPTPYYESIKK